MYDNFISAASGCYTYKKQSKTVLSVLQYTGSLLQRTEFVPPRFLHLHREGHPVCTVHGGVVHGNSCSRRLHRWHRRSALYIYNKNNRNIDKNYSSGKQLFVTTIPHDTIYHAHFWTARNKTAFDSKHLGPTFVPKMAAEASQVDCLKQINIHVYMCMYNWNHIYK